MFHLWFVSAEQHFCGEWTTFCVIFVFLLYSLCSSLLGNRLNRAVDAFCGLGCIISYLSVNERLVGRFLRLPVTNNRELRLRTCQLGCFFLSTPKDTNNQILLMETSGLYHSGFVFAISNCIYLFLYVVCDLITITNYELLFLSDFSGSQCNRQRWKMSDLSYVIIITNYK